MKTHFFGWLLACGASLLITNQLDPESRALHPWSSLLPPSHQKLKPFRTHQMGPDPLSRPPKTLLVRTLTGVDGLGIDLYPQQHTAVFHLRAGSAGERVFRVQFTCGKAPEVDVLTVTGLQNGEEVTSNPPTYHQDAQRVTALLVSMQVRWDATSVTVAARPGAALFTLQEGQEGPVDLHEDAAHAFCEGGILKLDSSGLQALSTYTFLANPVIDIPGNTYAHKFEDQGEHVLLYAPVFTEPSAGGAPARVTDTVVLYLKKERAGNAYRVVPFTRLRGHPTPGQRQHFLLYDGVLYPIKAYERPGPALRKERLPLTGTLHVYSTAHPERASGWLKTVFDLDTQVLYTVPSARPRARFATGFSPSR